MDFEINKYKEDDLYIYVATCNKCQREYRIEVENRMNEPHTLPHVVKRQFEAVWLKHRIRCPKRFISEALILEPKDKFESNFSILVAHHFGLKKEVPYALYKICRSWDMTIDIIQYVLENFRDPEDSHFIDRLFTIARIYEHEMIINKISRAAGKEPPAISPKELDSEIHKLAADFTKGQLGTVAVKDLNNVFHRVQKRMGEIKY